MIAQYKNYFSKYYPHFEFNEDNFNFQEKCRIDWSNNFNKYGPTGHDTLKFIIDNYKSANLTKEFEDFIIQRIESSSGQKNVRMLVKDILMYPKSTYMGYVNFPESEWLVKLEEKVGSILCKIKPKIAWDENESQVRVVFEGLKKELLESIDLNKLEQMMTNVIPNTHQEHITLISSIVASKHDKSAITNLINEFNDKTIDLEFEKFGHTFSFDWPLHSFCVVLCLKSETINQFINEFSQRFEKVNVVCHTTIAIVKRS